MYGVVLMMALSGGADAPAMSDVSAEPAARYGDHGHKEYRLFGGRGKGCHGGGGCHGGYGGCYGGGSYGGCYGGYAGMSGGYGGCHGGSVYGGCHGGHYGSMGGGYYGAMPYEGSYGSSWNGTSPYQGGYQYGRSFEDPGYYDESGTDASATIVVRLPADARLTVDGSATRSTDSLRTFVSPPLQAGKDYQYTLRAEVMRDGKKVERTRDVNVRAGRTSEVNFDFAESIPPPGQ